MTECTGVEMDTAIVRKHACWSSVTPSVLMVSENTMGMPAIAGDV